MHWYQHYVAPQCTAAQVHHTEVHVTGARPVDGAVPSSVATAICYLSVVFLLGRLARALVGHVCPDRLRPYLLDHVTAFQLLACSMENGHIRAFAGDVGFMIGLVCVPFWAGLTITEGSANPCSYVMMCTQGKMGIREMLTRVLCQVTGGLMSYQYARLFWSLELSDGHIQRLALTHCLSDLKVSLVAGFTIEFFGTLSSMLLVKVTSTRHLPGMHLARCIADAAVVLAGVEFTGMYLNPINATNQTFGCQGTGKLEHLIVYWGAPFAAIVCAGVTQRHLHSTWKTMAVDCRRESNGICRNSSRFRSDVMDSTSKADTNKNGVIRIRSKTGTLSPE